MNVAARLEQAAEPGTVPIGEKTLRLVRDAVVVEPVAPLEVKGKTEPLAAFRLVQVTPGVAGFARRLDSPMVGRERELAKLRQTFGPRSPTARVSCSRSSAPRGSGSPGWSRSSSVRSERQRSSEAAASRTARDHVLPRGRGPEGGGRPGRLRRAGRDRAEDLRGARDGRSGSTLAQLFGAADRDSSVEETFWAVRSFLEAVADGTTRRRVR